MRFLDVRALRATLLLCLALAVAGTFLVRIAAGASAVPRGAPITVLHGRLPVYAYSPLDATSHAGPRPLTLYLHGICGDAARGCRQFKEGVTPSSWLLCPSAPTACPGGGATWDSSASVKKAVLREAERAADAMHPGAIDTSTARVLIGFSQGGYVGYQELRASPGRYRGALFIGADVALTSAELRAAGVRRVAVGAGRLDMTYRPLAKTAERLLAEGFAVRFVDLGNVGHTYEPARGETALGDAIAWLEESY
jgi:predicted esterase